MDLLDTDSECVQCKWSDMECTGHSECIQCKWCDMEWTYWTQTVSVYSVKGVVWCVLDTDSEYVQCKECDTQFTLLGVETLGLHITKGKNTLNNVDKKRRKKKPTKTRHVIHFAKNKYDLCSDGSPTSNV